MIVLQWFYVMGAMQVAHTLITREQEKSGETSFTTQAVNTEKPGV